MREQLEQIGKTYDQAIEDGRKGINRYQQLPEYITSDPDYPWYEASQKEDAFGDSGRQEIIDYLVPEKGMKCVDLGCALNFMFNGYDAWPSTYYGVDISHKTIQLLQEYVAKKQLLIGELVCGSMHETPFETSFFDIGTCIGSIEYFKRDFVEQVIAEIHRIMKPNGRFVLDIPNPDSKVGRIAMMIEEFMGRPDLFDLTCQEFEERLLPYFFIDKIKKGGMIQYYLRCKK